MSARIPDNISGVAGSCMAYMNVLSNRKPPSWYARYLDLLRDLYGGHCLLIVVLPDMIAAASIEDLRDAFRLCSENANGHLDRFEMVFEMLGERPTGSSDGRMAGLLARGAEILDQDGDPLSRDAGLIAFAQRLTEYVNCRLDTVRQLARRLGHREVGVLLGYMLGEERQMHRDLTRIAMVHAFAVQRIGK